ncbi:MAG: hypothetical protein IJ141_00125 [Lachnospiraceae bacterium]|nr:hypothetical protein [Lachnospiraceae bacterium]
MNYKKVFINLTSILNEKEKNDRKIFNLKRNKYFILDEDEYFKQCYKANNKKRNIFAEYYFLSNKCHLVSVYKNKLIWIDDEREERDGRGSYNLTIYNKEKDVYERRRITSTDLMAVVFDSKAYGKAKNILDKRGVLGFGRRGINDVVQAHHKDINKSNDEPDNIEVLTSELHEALHKDFNSSNNIQELMNIISKEEPDKITLILTGKGTNKDIPNDYLEIEAVDSIKIAEKGYKQLLYMIYGWQGWYYLNSVINNIVKEKDVDFFKNLNILHTLILFSINVLMKISN